MKQFKRKLHKLFPDLCTWDDSMQMYVMRDSLKSYLRRNMDMFQTTSTKSIYTFNTERENWKMCARMDTINYFEQNLEKVLFELL